MNIQVKNEKWTKIKKLTELIHWIGCIQMFALLKIVFVVYCLPASSIKCNNIQTCVNSLQKWVNSTHNSLRTLLPTILQVASSHRPHLPFFMLPSSLVEVAHHLNDSLVLSLELDLKRRSSVQLLYSWPLNVKGNLHCLTLAVQPVVSVKFLGFSSVNSDEMDF